MGNASVFADITWTSLMNSNVLDKNTNQRTFLCVNCVCYNIGWPYPLLNGCISANGRAQSLIGQLKSPCIRTHLVTMAPTRNWTLHIILKSLQNHIALTYTKILTRVDIYTIWEKILEVSPFRVIKTANKSNIF